MLTDWLLIRRLAAELDERLRGGRLELAGHLADGRIALDLRVRGKRCALAFDLFFSPPVVTLEEPAPLAVEPGFERGLNDALRGMTLRAVNTRRGDRLLRLRFAARSRFGVGEELELYAELVPRYGNLVLVKGDTVVAALKEFSPAENARRAVQAGSLYALPPLPATPRLLSPDAQGADAGDPRELLDVYRRDGALQQVYVTPLDGYTGSDHMRAASLLELFAELRTEQIVRSQSESGRRRGAAIAKRLDERERKLRSELEALRAKRERTQQRDGLRAEGEAIFASLHELGELEQEPAKERAAALFAQYKKLGKSVPHIDARERAVAAALAAIETMRWELERAGDEEIADVGAAVAELDPRGAKPSVAKRAKRPRLEFRTDNGSRIVVGRSPIENAELTFHFARPNDLWFHAQGIPGAHVILARDDRGNVPGEDLETAAAFAAFYSKARNAGSVPVDYTLRKHVRKQRAAAPGLVWYTNAKTLLARPRAVP
ncbi:MAG: NFACT RNA binding domain-containing protein [Candidatus Baltobacteraceae bacterium]